MEQAIRTQRDALLRLLAGWLALVVFLSVAPISAAWTRGVRTFVASLLWRAEAAAQCLVIVHARRLTEDRAGLLRLRAQGPFEPNSDTDEPPSLAELRARLLALRCLLNALPRRARQLVRRLETGVEPDTAPAVMPDAIKGKHLAVSQCWPPAPWHPPKVGRVHSIIDLP